MGNGCTKNIRVLNKNSVTPNDAIKSSTPFTISHVQPIKINVTQSATATKPNSIEDIPSTSSVNGNSQMLQTFNHSTKTDEWNLNSSSHFNINPDVTSIIFDKIESTPVNPSFIRSVSVDSQISRSVKSAEIKVNRFSTPLHRLFKSNQNLLATTTTTTTNVVKKSENTPKFYHRFSTSMQSLFSGNLSNNRKRNLSASDTSLNKRYVMSQQQLIDNDYCPSVLFNRKARKSNNVKNMDKTQSFSRWTNQLLQKFSRKKNDPKARKS